MKNTNKNILNSCAHPGSDPHILTFEPKKLKKTNIGNITKNKKVNKILEFQKKKLQNFVDKNFLLCKF